MLGPTICILAIYLSLMIGDFINTLVAVILSLTNKFDQSYDEFLIFKMIIRRISILTLFKVMFTLNRVKIQMDPQNDTEEKIYSKLARLICMERLYLISFSLLFVKISVLILMVADHYYLQNMKKTYELLVVIISPIICIIKLLIICYFIQMSRFFLNDLKDHFNLSKCKLQLLLGSIGFL